MEGERGKPLLVLLGEVGVKDCLLLRYVICGQPDKPYASLTAPQQPLRVH